MSKGRYRDLTGRPPIYSKISQLENDMGLMTKAEMVEMIQSMNFSQVNSDWNSTSGSSLILNKPVVRRVETYTGVTNSSGNFSVTYSTPFSVVPDVQPQLTAGTPSQVVRITASTVNGFTVNVTNRSSVTLLAVEVLLAATTPVEGASVGVLVTAR